jgi:hypothetical protein
MFKTTHINFVLAASVAAEGGQSPRASTPIGKAQGADGKWYTGFIAFDKATGVARSSDKTGNFAINWRPQG